MCCHINGVIRSLFTVLFFIFRINEEGREGAGELPDRGLLFCLIFFRCIFALYDTSHVRWVEFGEHIVLCMCVLGPLLVFGRGDCIWLAPSNK